jgi:hypothetical protein
MSADAAPAATEAWIRDHYARGADALDVDGFMRGLAEDVVFDSSNGAVVGCEAVRGSAVVLFSMLESLRHDIHRVQVVATEQAVVEAAVTYRFRNGTVLTLPATTTFRFRGNEVAEILLDIDTAAITAAFLGEDPEKGRSE